MEKKGIKNRPKIAFSLDDRGGRRSGVDRRQFSYDMHIPERRSGQDRRKGKDRRRDIVSQRQSDPSGKTGRKTSLID